MTERRVVLTGFSHKLAWRGDCGKRDATRAWPSCLVELIECGVRVIASAVSTRCAERRTLARTLCRQLRQAENRAARKLLW